MVDSYLCTKFTLLSLTVSEKMLFVDDGRRWTPAPRTVALLAKSQTKENSGRKYDRQLPFCKRCIGPLDEKTGFIDGRATNACSPTIALLTQLTGPKIRM